MVISDIFDDDDDDEDEVFECEFLLNCTFTPYTCADKKENASKPLESIQFYHKFISSSSSSSNKSI